MGETPHARVFCAKSAEALENRWDSACYEKPQSAEVIEGVGDSILGVAEECRIV